MDIRTVAERANVSIATVSRSINNVPTVNAKMAKRVWEVIRELNYFPNTQARALVSGRTRLLGLIVSEITNPFFPELMEILTQNCQSDRKCDIRRKSLIRGFLIWTTRGRI